MALPVQDSPVRFPLSPSLQDLRIVLSFMPFPILWVALFFGKTKQNKTLLVFSETSEGMDSVLCI